MRPPQLHLGDSGLSPLVESPVVSPTFDPKQNYGDYGDYVVEKPACLTTLPHDGRSVKDYLTHYMGCIRLDEREHFFLNEDIWGPLSADERGSLLSEKHAAAVSIASQLKRIQVIRKAIDNEKPKIVSGAKTRPKLVKEFSRLHMRSRLKLEPDPAASSDNDDDKGDSLVHDVVASHKSWHEHHVYQDGIEKVRKWRAAQKKEQLKLSPHLAPPELKRLPEKAHEFEELEDLIKYIRDHDNTVKNATTSNNRLAPPGNASPPDDIEDYDLEKDINAYIISFKKNGGSGMSGTDLPRNINPHVKGHFPHQRVALKYILHDKTILKGGARDDGEIRYLHIPSNNMEWVEELIGQYCDGRKPDLDSPKIIPETPASMLLRPQYWRGQQHAGGNKFVHARHLRPICERLSSNRAMAEDLPNNLVLFMPYLHWETDRKREAVARMIDDTVESHRQSQKTAKQEESALRKKEREGLDHTTGLRSHVSLEGDTVTALPEHLVQNVKRAGYHQPLTFEHAALGMLGKQRHAVFSINKYGRVKVENPLAQFLLDAARLYESMSTYRDQRMISEHLFGKAPLHPRRTLDQSHFWTLRSTRGRDRDQVVYRGTRMDPRNAHRLVEKHPQGGKKKTQHTQHPHQKGTFGFNGHYGTDEKDGEKKEDPKEYYWSCLDARRDTGMMESEDEGEKPPGLMKRFTNARKQKGGQLPSIPEIEEKRASSVLHGVEIGVSPRGSNANSSNDLSRHGTSNGGNNGTAVQMDPGRYGSIAPPQETPPKVNKHITCDQCREDISKVSRVVMVDQLWMWILDEKTIITSFPRRYGVNKSDNSGVHKSICKRLGAARDNQFHTAFDVAMVILDECTSTFFDRTKTGDDIPRVMDIFSEAIGKVTNKQTTSFERVWYWTDIASRLYRSDSGYVNANDVQVSFLDIKHEGKVQREIKDIMEELDIMLHICRKQQEIIKRFAKHAESIISPHVDQEWVLLSSPWDQQGPKSAPEPRAAPSAAGSHYAQTMPNSPVGDDHLAHYFDEHAPPIRYAYELQDVINRARKDEMLQKLREVLPKMRQREKDLKWFSTSAAELAADMEDRVQELELLKTSAVSTAQSINDLLGLKQQQASVVQAWQGVQQAQETVKQGRAIMVFTMITLIFLPLSFMSSVFGMNNDFFNESWTLTEQFRLMFPISFFIILFVTFVAFGEIFRAIFWCTWALFSNYFMVLTRMYYVWLCVRDDWSSESVVRRVDEHVLKLRAEVAQQRARVLRDRTVQENERKSKEEERRRKLERMKAESMVEEV